MYFDTKLHSPAVISWTKFLFVTDLSLYQIYLLFRLTKSRSCMAVTDLHIYYIFHNNKILAF